MSKKIIIGILFFAVAITLGLGIFLYLSSDKNGPVIHLNENLPAYEEGTDETILLEGVTAVDDVDGDVTDALIIDSIIPISNKNSVKVTYVARDKSNNITREVAVIGYIRKNSEEQEEEAEANSDTQQETSNEAPDEQSANETNTDLTSGIPVIKLTQNEVVIQRGSAFTPISYVAEVMDQEDNKFDLHKRISVEGSYDTNKQGTYSLQYFVMDSDGNKSNVEVLTLVVQ